MDWMCVAGGICGFLLGLPAVLLLRRIVLEDRREKAHDLLRDVVSHLESDHLHEDDGNAPGHCHGRPGIWDATGEPCEWCATFRRAREYVKRQG